VSKEDTHRVVEHSGGKTCARSAPGQHLDKCCEKPSEGSTKHKECAKGKAIYPYKLRRKSTVETQQSGSQEEYRRPQPLILR
jgi:hypothetical protein